MDARIDIITLGVDDLDAARRFYVDGLGWRPLLDVPDEVIFVQVGRGIVLGLYTGLAGDAGTTLHGGDGHPPISLAHNVGSDDDVHAVMARAEAAGATVVKPVQRGAVGFLHGYFADPAGFLWEVAHNPGWVIGADGAVSIGPPD